jgi:hypothetical protein
MVKYIGLFILTLLIGGAFLGIGEKLSVPGVHGVTSPAEARLGRPLTPVSVAGVARRTVRRCAVGVYYC